MYTPTHLQYLDRVRAVDGWPPFVTPDGKEYAVRMLRRGLEKYGQMDLDLAHHCVFGDYVRQSDERRPECLSICLWDAIYAVTYRALLEVGVRQVFVKS